MILRTKTAGMLTTVQDLGRQGYMSQGFGPAGAMDSWSYRAANVLVGNDENAPALEFCLMGPSFEVLEDNTPEPLFAAFAGALFQPTLNGIPVPLGVTIPLHPGDILAAGSASEGVYGYLALSGGINVPQRFGSCSTSLKYHVGGFEGRALQAGDQLSCCNGAHKPPRTRALPPWLRMTTMLEEDDQHALSLALVPGAQESLFTTAGIHTFYSTAYTITPASDRMGLRLEGAAVESKAGSDIISDGIPLGAVQIPANGMPLIMMADRQTTGGYAKMGAVATVDIPKLAQCPAGRSVRFVRTSVEDAQLALRQAEKAFTTWANGEANPEQLLDHLRWQQQVRKLPSLEYCGPAHLAAIEPYTICSCQ